MINRAQRYTAKARRLLFSLGQPTEPVARERLHLITCIGADVEAEFVPHFLDHYLDLGIPPENFHVVVNSATENSAGATAVAHAMAQRNIAIEERWIEPYTSAAMWQKRRDVQRRCVPEQHWVVSADTDEFHEYPEALGVFLGECERHGINSVDGIFVDRVAEDGALRPVSQDDSPWRRFPLQAMVQGRIADFGPFHQPSGSIKLMAFDAALLPGQGGHNLVKEQNDARFLFGRSLSEYPQMRHAALRFRIPLRVHHFKWHAGLAETLKKRLEHPQVSPAGREYGAKLLAYFDANQGRIDLDDITQREAAGRASAIDWRVRVRAFRALHFTRLSYARAKRALD